MKIEGDDFLQAGDWFQFSTKKPHVAAQANFCIILPDKVYVTRYAKALWQHPDETPVIANWHGERRTDAYATTVGQLRAKAKEKWGEAL
jgi:hypothetical protein